MFLAKFPAKSILIIFLIEMMRSEIITTPIHWPIDGTYQKVLEPYKTYVHRHFTDAVVVFDGYDGETSTQKSEQKRRYRGKGEHQEILFQLSMHVTSTREKFLSNGANKSID